jgi:hypothetical protein
MPKKTEKDRKLTPDWFVHGALARLGDTFDKLTGRSWKPASSLATSELIERIKNLLDNEAREENHGRKFVPHNLKLRMQWDKFSTDAAEAMEKLKAELLTAIVDHINDRRYHTHAPLQLEVKPDYFIEGIKIYAGFEKFDDAEREVELDVTMPHFQVPQELLEPAATRSSVRRLTARYTENGKPVERELSIEPGKGLSIGRTGGSDIVVADNNVSKMHASLVLNRDGELVIADTGSTNGTFVSGNRIPYGRAVKLGSDLAFTVGTVEVKLELGPEPEPTADPKADVEAAEEVVQVGEFQFVKRPEIQTENEETEVDENETVTSLEAATSPAIQQPKGTKE